MKTKKQAENVRLTNTDANAAFRRWLERVVAKPPDSVTALTKLPRLLQKWQVSASSEATCFVELRLGYLLQLVREGDARDGVERLFLSTARAFCREQVRDCKGDIREEYKKFLKKVEKKLSSCAILPHVSP